MGIYDCLSKSFCKTYGIKPNQEYEIEYINPKDLIQPEKIDLVIKYKYVQAYENGRDLRNIKRIYKACIEAYSEGTFIEPGQEETKNCIDDYFAQFDVLIEHIKRNGLREDISAVPVNEKNIILNGSHRVAIALYFGLNVPCIRLPGIYLDSDYLFFYKRCMHENYLDYMSVGYCTLKSNIYAACVWPKGYRAIKENHLMQWVVDELSLDRKPICVKEFSVTYRECNDMVVNLYNPAEWLGSMEQGYPGARGKTDACFDKKGKMLLVLFEADEHQKVLEKKTEIRNRLKIEKNSIHITDTYSETVTVIKSVFYGRKRKLQNSLNDIKNGHLKNRLLRIRRRK